MFQAATVTAKSETAARRARRIRAMRSAGSAFGLLLGEISTDTFAFCKPATGSAASSSFGTNSSSGMDSSSSAGSSTARVEGIVRAEGVRGSTASVVCRGVAAVAAGARNEESRSESGGKAAEEEIGVAGSHAAEFLSGTAACGAAGGRSEENSSESGGRAAEEGFGAVGWCVTG